MVDCAISIVRHKGNILIAQRRADDRFGGYWEFPGGKCESGETLEACAVRETLEEVALRVRVERFLLAVPDAYGDKRVNLHFFLCTTENSEARPIECQAVRWVEPHMLKEYGFPPANDKVIEHLLQRDFDAAGI